ncbi:MAG: hypothetical protein A2315_16730 [Ignavibacteria bacterium RIFOXYB2_FULL_35_12]|nr:MAG: hypothetical protein A2X60_11690 [Ignavibacteria bacterium GWF2_35_20]OGU78474.1 MAG: hypothetical protein A2254_15145 [Ignavibacteria bacterium RIFOXYA2_FULL_35_9]OGU90124.1 MAG: hypothetical protein A3K31_05830 [Ignavibacteria bacterium RIFOXYA12_FULL_35_25]OGU92113.1 MAG: hypothetical protein A2492_01460 [Ignavibacteria bacterium RIFOXYC12_FULL_35_11]OGU95914.1 MAG: hypothetical protein A2347_10285 [Ignavibacteria bacterium RIFOXYB12_FULL_35_14]OGU99316.1 MAG: hypothetical protein A
MGIESAYNEIIKKLERFYQKEFKVIAAIGIQIAFLLALSSFFIFTLIEVFANSNSTVRTIFFVLFLIVAIAALVVLFILPLLKYFKILGKPDYDSVARKVGSNFPEVKDELLNALQLNSIHDKQLYSSGLIGAAFIRIYEKVKNISFDSAISFEKVKKLLYYVTGVSVFIVLLFWAIPGLKAASGRLLNFNQEFIPPQKFYFEISPGNAQVTKGQNVIIKVQVKGEKPKEVFLAFKDIDQTNFNLQKLSADSLGNYNFERHLIRNTFIYFATAENISGDEYKIEVIDRPVIKSLEITINSPNYSKIPTVQQKDNGNITALNGSTVNLEVASSKELSKAKLFFGDSISAEMKTSDSKASLSFRVRKDNSYQIILADEKENQNLSPITYTIKTLFDAYPSIEMITPNRDVSLANDNRLPILVKITDDYGFTKLNLNYRLSASRYEPEQMQFSSIEIPINKNEREVDLPYVWNLSRMTLGTDDVVTYYLELFDNDNVSGPKSTKSPEFKIRVPSLDEILAKVEDTQQKAQEELIKTLKEAEELKENLEKLNQEMKQDKKELTWEEKEKIENALNKFEELQNKVDEVSKQLGKMQNELQQNNLLSKETLEKYMELQELFQELTSDEMKKAMEQLRNRLNEMNRQQAQQDMQNLKIDEEMFQKSIERTINLLKRIQVEQKIDEMLKRTEQLAENLEKLEKQTGESDLSKQQDKKELADKQNQAGKEMEKLEKEMKELSDKMKSLEDMPNEQMDKAMEEMENQDNQELSEEAMKNLMQNQKQMAQNNQSQMSKNMKQMNQMMKQLQQAMQQMNQMQTFTDMMKILDNLLTLSKKQEELKKESQNLNPNSSQFNENAQQQNNLSRSLDNILSQMSELSQKTFAITPEMGKAMGDANRKMQESIQAMQNRNGNMAANNQGEAMKSLNEAATMMKSSMEAMMQGGGQGGMMSLMQQLQKMSGMQMSLNNLTQMLQQGMQGKLSPQQQAELQRLGQQQELIRKSLEQLQNEAKQTGQSKKMPANLENILKQMQEVVSDMQTERLNDELVQKQERILSRLLDAQRSINERDYEKERESFTGENMNRKSPAELNLSSERGKDLIKDELNKAGREGYSKDYENLIRKYFEALQSEKIKN